MLSPRHHRWGTPRPGRARRRRGVDGQARDRVRCARDGEERRARRQQHGLVRERLQRDTRPVVGRERGGRRAVRWPLSVAGGIGGPSVRESNHDCRLGYVARMSAAKWKTANAERAELRDREGQAAEREAAVAARERQASPLLPGPLCGLRSAASGLWGPPAAASRHNVATLSRQQRENPHGSKFTGVRPTPKRK